jgi:5-methylcytosine-specific restriction protein A
MGCKSTLKEANRTRGRKWMQIRASILSANPLCVICKAKGIIKQATQVDHIQAITNDGTDDNDNLQSICTECHKIKTAQDLGQTPRSHIGPDGWPIE